MLTFGAGLLGGGEQMRRLCGSLAVDSTPARLELGWVPPVPMDAALARAARWYEDSEAVR
jgi:UDP-glucose 4-epimerase